VKFVLTSSFLQKDSIILGKHKIMDDKKISKKELKSLFNDAMQEAIIKLELPAPTKKIKKVLNRQAKELASEYKELLKAAAKDKMKLEKLLKKSVAKADITKKKAKRKSEEGEIINGIDLDPIKIQ